MNNELLVEFPHFEVLIDLSAQMEWVVGVAKSCDLTLTDYLPSDETRIISRRHLKLVRVADGSVVVNDLGSTNGTYLNGERMVAQRAYVVTADDQLELAGNPIFLMCVRFRQTSATTPYYHLDPITPTPFTPMRTFYADDEGRFVLDGKVIPATHFTPIEEQVLSYLYAHSGEVVSYEQIISHVWGYDETVQNNTVAKVVSNLRRKLNERADGAGDYILRTVWGRGIRCQPL
ncbi:MAG: winged helix-turn-helix domain-containing protein [Anaerolineales bacterium]|nr:winged helix-turn-helix domain-containing protein [Anaerolineales bacterium]MCB9126830.1 winged helix-turn-helix domain-containing protein [Ardenticatenales bacterium]